MVVNKLQNNLRIAGVKAPIFNPGEYLEDIAVISGATVISKKLGHQYDRVDPVYCVGKFKKIEIQKDKTIMIKGEGKEELIQTRQGVLEEALKVMSSWESLKKKRFKKDWLSLKEEWQ